MLSDVLASNRSSPWPGSTSAWRRAGRLDPPHRVAGIGIVRRARRTATGRRTCCCRVSAASPSRESSRRTLPADPHAGAAERAGRAATRTSASAPSSPACCASSSSWRPRGGNDRLSQGDRGPETFVDVAAFNLCESPALKQKLLETLDVHDRFELFIRRIRREIDALRLRRNFRAASRTSASARIERRLSPCFLGGDRLHEKRDESRPLLRLRACRGTGSGFGR